MELIKSKLAAITGMWAAPEIRNNVDKIIANFSTAITDLEIVSTDCKEHMDDNDLTVKALKEQNAHLRVEHDRAEKIAEKLNELIS